MPVDSLNNVLALGTIALFIGAIGFIKALFWGHRFVVLQSIRDFAGAYGLATGFVFSLSGSALTLVYSEIFGFPPCPLCWWQRVCLYPQVVLFAIALKTRDTSVALYSIALSTIGLGIAAYHHLLQVLPSGSLPCPAEGVVSCGQRFVFEFGFVTFPLMSAALFAFLIAVMLVVRARR